jgi:hypothetical protein
LPFSHDREVVVHHTVHEAPSGRTDAPLTGLHTRRLRCRK